MADDPFEPSSRHDSSRRQLLRSVVAGVPCGIAASAVAADEARAKPAADEKAALPEDSEKAEIDRRMSMILAKFGGKLDDAQKAAVRKDVEANFRRAVRLRGQKLDDLEGPATSFRPIAADSPTEVFISQPALKFEPTGKSEPLTKLDDKVAFATLDQLAEGLRAGRFSAVDLARFFLDRLESHGPKVNCVATLTRETALRQAEAADKRIKAGLARGPLDGIPYGAKDLLAAKGYPTSNGCKPYVKRMVETDANVVRKLEAAGSVLVAKLSMVECAGGLGYRQANASAFGPGLTPYDTSRWSGGSSSGSGSAVAAGLVPFAIGSETWGSITTPASYCGLTGLRPTYGRVGRSGAFALSYTLDKIGPMTHTAADAWTVLQAIAGYDEADPSTRDVPWRDVPVPLDRPLKLAVLKGGVAKAQPAQRENFEKALAVFREFAEVTEIDEPEGPFADVLLTILAGESASAFEEMIDSGAVTEMTAPEDRIGGYADRVVTAAEFVRAQRLRGPLCRKFDEYLKPFDAILTVPTAATAPSIAKNFGSEFSHKSLGGPGNLSGTPALVLPMGLDAEGLPTALQMDTRAFGEAILVRLGHVFQARTSWHTQKPGKPFS